MKTVWLQTNDGKEPTISFNKIYKKEYVRIDNGVVIVHNDKNFQIISVEGHPELSFLRGRPFALCVEQIKELCRKEDNNE